ncbi:MAG TPA: hypothetical protein VFR95_10560 [Gemmatimonadaceae bacterium]|nr:hypothetical protein [Gemmatimonadaceae bacterium]
MLQIRKLSLGVIAASLLGSVAASRVAAQSPIASYGVTAAAFEWRDGHQEQALGAIVQLTPTHWLTLGASPTLLRVTGVDGSESQFGVTDLPVYAGVVHTFAAPWRPTIGVAGVASLPTGDAERGLGRGKSLLSAQGALAVSPFSAVALRAGASRLLRVGDAAPSGAPTTSLFGDVVLLAGARTNLSVGYATELRGDAPSTYEPARAVNAAMVHSLFGPVVLGMSAGKTVQGMGPRWSFAVGIGTAFAGLSPVGATSPSARGAGGMTNPSGALPTIGGASCRLLGGC